MKTAHTEIHNISAVRTLIADDSPFMLKAFSQILASEGIFILAASATDGSQAVRHALAIKPELILMDVHMPRLNGIEATRYIKQFPNETAYTASQWCGSAGECLILLEKHH